MRGKVLRVQIGLSVLILASLCLLAISCQQKSDLGLFSKEKKLVKPIELSENAEVDFNFHVKPILSDNCFACHGPDEAKRDSGLRLDTYEGATENYAVEEDSPLYAIVPGDPENSEIWKRINHTNPDLVMPSKESNKDPLNDLERSIIRRWIEQGAPYEPHWAFISPEKSELPRIKKKSWTRNEIDHFILEKIEELGIKPSPEADKETLIRRVTLDVTGLPPTPDEIDAFLADKKNGAYERLVDRLLSSPHYGERMALDWLDVSRYGDTNAHHVDLERTSWPWRDWVIRAFNENKPYDIFIIEQVAGDLLEDPSLDQILATSFNRNHPITNEGGAISEEYLVEYAADRVHTVSTAFLGMTMACARCHDHKFDPFSIEEYYQMISFFNSIEEVGLEKQIANEAQGYRPFISITRTPEEQSALKANQAALEDLLSPIQALEWNEAQATKSKALTLGWKGLKSSFPQALWNGKKIKGPNKKNFIASFTQSQQEVLYEKAGSLAFDISLQDLAIRSDLIMVQFNARTFHQSGDKFNAHSTEGNSRITEIDLELVTGKHHQAKTSKSFKVAEAWTNDDLFVTSSSIARAFDSNSATSWDLEPSDRPLMLVLRLDEPLPQGAKTARLRMTFHYGEDSLPPVQRNAFQVYAAKSTTSLDELQKMVQPFSLIAVAPKNVLPQYQDELAMQWALAQGMIDQPEMRKWATLRDAIFHIEDQSVRVAVMSEKPEPKPTFVLDRGAYDAPLKDHPLSREIPQVFGSLNSEYPKNRLGLAQWLVEEENPLTARVTVNRYWQMIFGAGLVRTPEDFGAQGEFPSHPELLDTLAVEFIESGWDTKALIRKMVTSSTYRQQSITRTEMKVADPQNKLLSWFPRQRLKAEFIRDNALSASGLLVPKVGGPSVKPYQPDGLWKEKAMRKNSNTGIFKRDSGEDLYRRGMYTFWKQVAPPPQMEAFDAPSRNVCVIKRSITNTPMQALTLLNDVTYLEVSRSMAVRLISEVPGNWEDTLDKRITLAYRYLTGRRPSSDGLKVLRQLALDARQSFSQETANAEDFLNYGESPVDKGMDPIESASLAFTASAILNLDKTITRD
ncbi:MAG: PSD1 and planctomycete cytochrome C domain-containing protein [Verrucomicrobiota bacterium]